MYVVFDPKIHQFPIPTDIPIYGCVLMNISRLGDNVMNTQSPIFLTMAQCFKELSSSGDSTITKQYSAYNHEYEIIVSFVEYKDRTDTYRKLYITDKSVYFGIEQEVKLLCQNSMSLMCPSYKLQYPIPKENEIYGCIGESIYGVETRFERFRTIKECIENMFKTKNKIVDVEGKYTMNDVEYVVSIQKIKIIQGHSKLCIKETEIKSGDVSEIILLGLV
jgi:hypothetical protein